MVYCTPFINTKVFAVNDMCRIAGPKFVLCVVSGLLGVVFEDFGAAQFESELHSGRPTEEIPIKELRADPNGTWVVSLSAIGRMTHGIDMGSLVKFTGVPAELTNSGPFTVRRCNFNTNEGEFLIDKKFDTLPSLAGFRPFVEVFFPTKQFTFVRKHLL